jgi:hypothetical protein
MTARNTAQPLARPPIRPIATAPNPLKKKIPGDLRARPQPQQALPTQDFHRSTIAHQPLFESVRTDVNRPSALGMLQAANANRVVAPDHGHIAASWNVMPDAESDEEDHAVCSSPAKKEPDLADVMRNIESSFSELS